MVHRVAAPEQEHVMLEPMRQIVEQIDEQHAQSENRRTAGVIAQNPEQRDRRPAGEHPRGHLVGTIRKARLTPPI